MEKKPVLTPQFLFVIIFLLLLVAAWLVYRYNMKELDRGGEPRHRNAHREVHLQHTAT